MQAVAEASSTQVVEQWGSRGMHSPPEAGTYR